MATYPEGLPCPAAAPLTSAERRTLAESGPFETRTFERDWRALRTLTFPPMRATYSKIFFEWWRDDLIFGGAWWSAPWVLPDGAAEAEYRFVGTPKKSFVAPHHWVVTAVCEVRAAGAILPLYYTSWPYALFHDQAFDIAAAEPIAGQLWVQPLTEVDLSAVVPQSGTLDTVLQSYDAPAQEIDLGAALPQSGTLDVQLNSYDAPAEAIDLRAATPRSGTLLVQLVTYDQPPDEVDLEACIPLSGTLA